MRYKKFTMQKFIYKTALILFIFFTLAAAFSACGPNPGNQPGSPRAETEQPGTGQPGDGAGAEDGANNEPGRDLAFYEELYHIPMSVGYSWYSSEWVVNRDGATIPENQRYAVFYDVLSGAPQCLALTRIEGRGVDENGITLVVDRAALFDLDGNLIYDWGDYSYSAGFGDFIIRRENEPMPYYDFWGEGGKSELLNFKTNQSYLADVNMVYRLSDDEALLLDNNFSPLGVVDSAGTKRSGFPVDGQYVYARDWNGYILARNRVYDDYGLSPDTPEREQTFLLTPDFEQILAYDQLNESMSGEILEYTEGMGTAAERSGLVAIDGRELYRVAPGETIFWFNDNFIITRYDDYRSSARHGGYKIIGLSSGETLFDNAEAVSYSWNDDVEPLESLLVYSSGFLCLVNCERGEIGRKEVDEVSHIEPLTDGLFCVYTQSTNLIIDEDLAEAIPGGIYNYVYRASRRAADTYDYYDAFICGRYNDQYRFVDLLDLDGRVLVEGLNDIYDAGPDRIAVRKGFDVGLMDWHGNWIVKRSIFSELQDD